MKKLNQLTVGDVIYFIDKSPKFLDYKDEYGNNYSQYLYTKIIIKSIHLSDGTYLMNWNGEKGNYSRFDCGFNASDSHKSSVRNKAGDIFFSDLCLFNRIAQRLVINEINRIESKIKADSISLNQKIEKLRERYMPILSPVMFKTDMSLPIGMEVSNV